MVNDQYKIGKDLSKKILFLGVSKKTKGGMSAVLVSYSKYIEGMQFIPTWKLGNKFVKGWYALPALVGLWGKCIFDKNIEIIHIHGAANASFYRCQIFIKQAKRFRKKVILHEHAADFREFYDKAKDKKNIVDTVNSCDKLIVLSLSWKEFFKKIGVIENKIEVLNNIVSPPIMKRVKYEEDKLHVLFLGEISIRKGGYDLLKAIAKNKAYFGGKLKLRIGGNIVDGDIREFITKHQLENIVSYEGWIAGEHKIECLNWMDVYILPSYNEGLPIAILEAMSYKHPVISTPVGGIPEVVHNSINGILVTPGNILEIAEALQFYIEHPEAIKKQGEESYKIVEDFFPDKVFADLENIYVHLLS